MKARADYRVLAENDAFVLIVDLDRGNRSVTNDAEAVAAEVAVKHGNKRILYRDSDRRWDEIVHEKGVFKGFGILADQAASPEWLPDSVCVTDGRLRHTGSNPVAAALFNHQEKESCTRSGNNSTA